MTETQTVVKKVIFEQPHAYIRELLEALNADHDKDILDVPASCQSIDVFSLAFEKDSFYIGAMTLKPLKKGGWGGAKTCSRSSDEKVSPFVDQVYRRAIGNNKKIGAVEYYELKTEVDFLLLKELITRGFLFWERNTHQRITFAQNPWPLAFEWVYNEASHTYSFNVRDLAQNHVFIKKPHPLLFDYDTGTFYNISSSTDQRTLTHLLSLPPLKPEYTDYISKQLKGKKVPELAKPKSLIVKKAQPTPILTFKCINENYELYAGAMLSFKYETKECSNTSSIKKFESMKDGDLIHIERDTSFENTLIQNTLLEKMEFLRAVRYGYGREYYDKKDVFVPNKANTATTAKIKDTYWHKFLSTDLVQFKKNGFIIRFDDNFPYKPASEDDWYVNIEPSENNWFDTEIGVTINGEKINLLPILLKIIRSKDNEILNGYKVDVTLKLEDGREVLVRRDRINQLLTFMRSIMKIGANDDTKTKNTLKLSLLDALQLEQFKETDFNEADWSGSKVLCVFQSIRSSIPILFGHRFQQYPGTDSNFIRA